MSDSNIFESFIHEIFKHDISAAASILEHMPESDASKVLSSLPPSTVVHAFKHLQISYAAELLKNADEEFIKEIFTQSCRMQIYGMKDLLLPQEQINKFDRVMDSIETVDEEKIE